MEINTNWRQIHYPLRIVCTTTESVDILYRLGLGEKIVGVSGFANEPPKAREKNKNRQLYQHQVEKIKE